MTFPRRLPDPPGRSPAPGWGSLAAAAIVTLLPTSALAQTDGFSSALEQGFGHAAGMALLGGLLVCLTPCVYPMIAITVSVFGARESRSRAQGVALSAMFVLGIVAMFVPMGVTAGLTGGLFGSVLQSRWVILGIAALFLAMAASLLGAFETALPPAIVNRLARIGGMGPRGAFGLGLVCGLIAAPCTGPVLTGILAWIARSQNAWGGALAMGAFSIGLGLPFFLVGAFAVQLPKAGRWMVHVKSVLGLTMVVVALYYLNTAFPVLASVVPAGAAVYFVAIPVLLSGLLLGAIHRDFGSPRIADRVLKSAGALAVTLSAFALISRAQPPGASVSWTPARFDEARSRAISEHRPLLVDFTAAWCGSCRELESVTFADPEVVRESTRFLAVKVDATGDDDPEIERIMSEFDVVGLPTVVLFDSDGDEVTRFTDFVGPEAFRSALGRVN